LLCFAAPYCFMHGGPQTCQITCKKTELEVHVAAASFVFFEVLAIGGLD
jgi:hypothetical protein